MLKIVLIYLSYYSLSVAMSTEDKCHQSMLNFIKIRTSELSIPSINPRIKENILIPSFVKNIAAEYPQNNIRLVIGLGNFVPEYFKTPHNLGMSAVERIINSLPKKNFLYADANYPQKIYREKFKVSFKDYVPEFDYVPDHEFEYDFISPPHMRTKNGEIHPYREGDKIIVFTRFFGKYNDVGEYLVALQHNLGIPADQVLIIHDNAHYNGRMTPPAHFSSIRGNFGLSTIHASAIQMVIPKLNDKLNEIIGKHLANEMTRTLLEKTLYLGPPNGILDKRTFVRELKKSVSEALFIVFKSDQAVNFFMVALESKRKREVKIRALINSLPQNHFLKKNGEFSVIKLCELIENSINEVFDELNFFKIQIGYSSELSESGLKLTDFILKDIDVDHYLTPKTIRDMKKAVLTF
jgi:peptidyl-tRNA hydrolase